MKNCLTVAALAAALWGGSVHAQENPISPRGEIFAYDLDSTELSNVTNQRTVVYRDFIRVRGAGWMRVYFGEDTTLGPDSAVRVTSLQDNEVHELRQADLLNWSYSTAYLNGDAVLIELIAGPSTVKNRLVVDEIAFEMAGWHTVGLCGICNGDNRVQSNVHFAGRILPSGCSGAVWNEQSCIISAGHCVSGGAVIQFNVPNSTPGCQLQNPSVADQFPVATGQSNNGGVGHDWWVTTSGTNSGGQTIYERYGEYRPINNNPPSPGQSIDIWGYGSSENCVVSQTQQHSVGNITSISGLFFNHNADAPGGNSGSGVLRNDEIIGIVTHCPCPNVATRVTHPAVQVALGSVCPVPTGACCYVDGSCQIVSEDDCTSGGGEYITDDWPCVPQPCPAPTGACCTTDGTCAELEPDLCTLIGGTYQGHQTLCVDVECEGGEDCPEDIDGSGAIDFGDLLAVLSNWGPCP